jgi:hypothetical protein
MRVLRLFAITLLLLVAFSPLAFASTIPAPSPTPSPPTSPIQGVSVNEVAIESNNEALLNNSQARQFYNTNNPGYPERFTAGIIISAVNWIMNLFYMSDPVYLVFGDGPQFEDDFLAKGLYGPGSRDSMVMGTFPEQFFSAISILYTAFERLLPIPLAIALVVVAIMLMINSGSAEGRSRQKDYIGAFLVAFIAMRFGHYLWYWIFAINNFLVELIWAYMISNGVANGLLLDMIWGTGKGGFDETVKMGSLPLAILVFLAAMMCLALNYQYTMRMIILGMLIAIFPIVATLSVFPAFRHSLQTWTQEFIANVVVQLAHAIALGGFFITMATGIGSGGGFWLMIAYFGGLPALSNIVRQLVGLQGTSTGALGGVSAMMGFMAVANMARMLKRSPSVPTTLGTPGTLPDAGGAVSGGGGSTFAPLSGAASIGGKIAQGAYNTVGRVATNPFAQKVAKFGVGATAAVTGGIISGMATGNPVAGLALGTGAGVMVNKLGGKLLGGIGEVIGDGAGALSSGQGFAGGWEGIKEDAKEAGSTIMANSMAKNGFIANAGWGLQRAANLAHSLTPFGKGDLFKAPHFIDENKANLNMATKGMATIKPELDVASAKYEEVKAKYGKGSEWYSRNFNPQTGKIFMPDEYNKAEQNYHKVKAEYDGHKASAMQANANLRNYNELKKYTVNLRKDDTAFSTRRGTL